MVLPTPCFLPVFHEKGRSSGSNVPTLLLTVANAIILHFDFGVFLTLRLALSTAITFQLSVEKAMASRAAETSEKMEAKHKVTALQKAMVMIETQLFFYM